MHHLLGRLQATQIQPQRCFAYQFFYTKTNYTLTYNLTLNITLTNPNQVTSLDYSGIQLMPYYQ